MSTGEASTSAGEAKSIRALREERGWTVADLGRAAGVPDEQVERWEAGDPDADPARFGDIVGRGLGVPWTAIQLPDGWRSYGAGGCRFLMSARRSGEMWTAALRANHCQDPTLPGLPQLNAGLHAEGESEEAAFDTLRIKIDTHVAGATVSD